VIVTIAKSSIPSAGLEIFLGFGPAEDNSVPPGTIKATYEGLFLKTQAGRDHVKSDVYRFNCVWVGINPFTGEILIVPLSMMDFPLMKPIPSKWSGMMGSYTSKPRPGSLFIMNS